MTSSRSRSFPFNPLSLTPTRHTNYVTENSQGFEYTRSDNPNRAALESLLASIEAGGQTALALSSGSSATSLIVSALGSSAHVLSVNDVYGGTARYLRHVGSALSGLQTTFVDMEALSDEDILKEFRPNTKAVWIETPTNPTLRLIDIPRIVRLARQAASKPIVLVDNTFMSPFFQSPLLLGADVVLHSITKYINGHSDVLMGAVVLPSQATLVANGSALGPELADKLRFLQNAMGAVPSAYDCWLAQRGAKTLALRMKAHGTNALLLAKYLDGPARAAGLVSSVIYPGLPSTASGGRKGFELVRDALLSPHARKWIDTAAWEGAKDGVEGVPFGGMLSFRIAPRSASAPSLSASSPAELFLTSTSLFTLAESLGGVESLAELPARMTHGGLPAQAREELGISEDLIRLSVGVEEAEDLVADVERALRWSVRGEKWVEGKGWSVQV